MKLEHLIQAYNFNSISSNIEKQIEDKKERAGVIKFNDNIHASYLLDDEDIVIALNIFCNCVVDKNTIEMQLQNVIDIIKIIQKSIELLGNTTQEEANKILDSLYMFEQKLETKSARYINHIYKIEVVNGLLIFSIIEDDIKNDLTK